MSKNDDLIGSKFELQTFGVIFGHNLWPIKDLKHGMALEFLSPLLSELKSIHPERSYVDLFFFNR